MDFDTLVSGDSLEEVTCILCKNFLSFFPIWTKSSKENICGRCAPYSECRSYIRNAAYEGVAQFLKFPCSFKSEGCCEEVLPKEMPEHEKDCHYRTIKCPTEDFTKCVWEGSYPDLIQHCHDRHFDIILKSGEFEVDLSRSYDCRNLVIQDNTLFFVERKFDCADDVLQCAVYYSPSEVNYRQQLCHLSIKGGNRKVSVDFYTTDHDCMSFTDVYLGLNRGGTLYLSEASGQIIIGNVNCYEEVPTSKNNQSEIISALKNCLQCSQCSKFTMPPIYQCLVQRLTLCSQCENQHVSKCKTCAQCTFTADVDMRNVSLEKIAALMDYPCKNQEQGCDFSGTPDDTKSHQELCLYGNCECPLSEFMDCQWEGFGQDLKEHIKDNHGDSIVDSEVSVSLVPDDFMYCRVVKFSNHLFRLVFIKDRDNEERFCWSVQIIGCSDDNFQYEIELIDKSNCGRKLILKQPCAPLINLDELFQNDNYYCYCHLDQIESYLSERYKLTFKVHLSK